MYNILLLLLLHCVFAEIFEVGHPNSALSFNMISHILFTYTLPPHFTFYYIPAPLFLEFLFPFFSSTSIPFTNLTTSVSLLLK